MSSSITKGAGMVIAALLPILPLLGAAPVETTPSAPDGIACADLMALEWGGFALDRAELRDADANNPAHCLVQGTVPSAIRFELLLPLPEAWNGRFVMGGGGGYVGSIQNQATAGSGVESPLQRGFATVGTDTGHQASRIQANWALGRDDLEVDFAHRAVHVTAETAKTIIHLHYGSDIAYSYFIGCSRGGGQGTMESQRYPDDFDGIVSGAPARDWAGIGAQFTQSQLLLYPDPSAPPVLDADARALLERAILERCDDLDGVMDGVMSDPRRCSFQPEDLPRCTAGESGSDCVTDAQVAAIRAIYDGPTVNGEHVYSGLPFGGEGELAGWGQWIVGAPNILGPGVNNLHNAFGVEFFRYFVFDDPDWDFTKYDFSTWAADTRAAAELLNSTRTNLTDFETAGGKLILWNGWSDPAISALALIDYYEGVQAEHENAEDFVRLFLLPGVLHCASGPGPDQVEWLDVIQSWVEEGSAPDQVLASRRTNGEVEMQRPVCAYPAVARYDGTGDAKREESFSCGG
ncbi:MAG: tannase/feruloyl esterase family alpha/beta hydrolase [Acidobacteria bacterium]|nr:tannase/feruloyl esterase family alpha/beta hydrolase [Acidobacteriota bacterium]